MTNRVEILTENKYKLGKANVQLDDEFAKISLDKSQKESHQRPANNVHEIDEDDDDDNDDGIAKEKQDDELFSEPPSDYVEENRLYHIQFIRRTASNVQKEPEKKFKNGTRMSLHFTNDRMREIDRCNRILLKKILHSGPNHQSQISSARACQAKSTTSSQSSSRVTSATINRRKQQLQIEKDNEMLLKKLQKINRHKL